jgi:hypothetical protein
MGQIPADPPSGVSVFADSCITDMKSITDMKVLRSGPPQTRRKENGGLALRHL